MKKVLIVDKMSVQAEKVFTANGISFDKKIGLSEEEICGIVTEYEGIVVRSATKITSKIIQCGKKLKVLGRAGIGVDNIDIDAATKNGIVVMNTPFGNSITTAEHTISLMMSLARNIPQASKSTKEGKWEKSKFMGTELFGKTLGMIGCGNIGSLVVERCLGLKMKVFVFDPFLSKDQTEKIGAKKVELEEILINSDFITLHTPLTDKTKGILNKNNLSKCKDNVKIINCARGGLIVEDDLIELINKGKISGAALDVFSEEPPTNKKLFNVDNLILTPHLGASTSEAQENVAIQVAQQISDYLNNDVIVNSINVSPISLEDAPKLKPFIDLSLKLGKFGGQIIENTISKINITFKGEISSLNTKPLIANVVAGIFSNRMESVNLINAETIAKQKNIEIISSYQTETSIHTSEIHINISTTDEEFNYAGIIFANNSRIISIMNMRIECEISPNMLYILNNDKPGFIGSLGTLLGSKNINIANFNLGRTGQGEAVSLLELDQFLNKSVIDDLQKLNNIRKVKALKF